jgi:hypothetical protein
MTPTRRNCRNSESEWRLLEFIRHAQHPQLRR